jgi:hypothetical protein
MASLCRDAFLNFPPHSPSHNLLLQSKRVVNKSIFEFSIRIKPAVILRSHHAVLIVRCSIVDNVSQKSEYELMPQCRHGLERQHT